jgi:hypothetical protein
MLTLNAQHFCLKLRSYFLGLAAPKNCGDVKIALNAAKIGHFHNNRAMLGLIDGMHLFNSRYLYSDSGMNF